MGCVWRLISSRSPHRTNNFSRSKVSVWGEARRLKIQRIKSKRLARSFKFEDEVKVKTMRGQGRILRPRGIVTDLIR